MKRYIAEKRKGTQPENVEVELCIRAVYDCFFTVVLGNCVGSDRGRSPSCAVRSTQYAVRSAVRVTASSDSNR